MPIDSQPNRKCYEQLCTVTTALDVAGDRWTMLILRELLGGPARFEELIEGLPGIARNLLSSRLRRLEDDGLLRRVDAHGASLYALTELGAGARPALEELGFWGLRLPRVAPPVHARSIRAIAMAVQAILSRAGNALPTTRRVVELDVDDESIEVVVGPEPSAIARVGSQADVLIRTTRQVMSNAVTGQHFDSADFTVVRGDSALLTTFTAALRAPFRAVAGQD